MNPFDAVLIAIEMREARRRFRLHAIWSGVVAAVAITFYVVGVLACVFHVATRSMQ